MQKKQTILVVASLLVVVLSVTLAYFTAQIIGKGKDVSVSSADLKIVFTDTDGSISGTNIEPGWSDTKTFTIENKSNETYKYNIVIQDLVNTFVTEGYLQYKITSTNGGYNMTEFKDVPKSSAPKDTILAYSVSIPVGVTQSYTVEFKYANDESVDQSEDMGKTLSGTLYIEKGTEKPFNGGTLVEAIKYYNPTIQTRTDFSIVLTDDNTNTLYTSTEDSKTVYYFAGNAKNNWVKFGTFASDGPVRGYYSATISTYKEYTTLEECNSASSYNTNCSYPWRKGDPMYWRIIRTNSDESVRLLYHGTSTTSTEAYIGTSKFNSGRDNIAYVSYMYGSLGSIANARTNQTNSSTIKTAIDNWYKDYLNTNYGKYISTTAVYCNDRSTSGSNSFGAKTRLDTTNKTPSYNCATIEDKFTVDKSTGNGKLTYPIALMTADEVVFAGGKVFTDAKTWYYYNSANGISTGSEYWWLLSPYRWYDSSSLAQVFHMYGSAYPGELTYQDANNTYGVRPVLSLKSCTKYSTGNGSPETPYEIVETSSGC